MNKQYPVTLAVEFVQQQHVGECLAACAAMVLTYIGKPIAYRRLVAALEIIPGIGTPSSKIRNLARIGVNVNYQRGTLERLFSHIQSNEPCIAFVKTTELPYRDDIADHAVVVVGFDTQFVYLHDPEFVESPISVPHGDFDLAWLEHDEQYAVITR